MKLDFIIIGVQKAGTTWLQRRLEDHPNIEMAPDELHFFNYSYEKNFTSYHANFTFSKKITGEKTPTYFRLPTYERNVAKRLFDYNPNLKLIVILRDPRHRAISALKHHIRMGRIWPGYSLEKIFFEKKSFIKKWSIVDFGFYSKILESFNMYFDENSLKVMFYEDISKNQRKFLDEIECFLQIENGSLKVSSKRDNSFERNKLWLYLNFINKNLGNIYGRLHRYQTAYKYQVSNRLSSALNQIYREDIAELSKKFNVPNTWLEDAE